jgi:hypothetical protein
MAPRLALSNIQLIRDMLNDGVTVLEVGSTVECSRFPCYCIYSGEVDQAL